MNPAEAASGITRFNSGRQLSMMTIKVRVTTNAKRSEVAEGEGMMRVRLKAKPEDGRANAELIRVLSAHFGVEKNCVKILKGLKSRDKTVLTG